MKLNARDRRSQQSGADFLSLLFIELESQIRIQFVSLFSLGQFKRHVFLDYIIALSNQTTDMSGWRNSRKNL